MQRDQNSILHAAFLLKTDRIDKCNHKSKCCTIYQLFFNDMAKDVHTFFIHIINMMKMYWAQLSEYISLYSA